MRLSLFTLTVLDYDRAIDFYVTTLGFTLLEDTDLGAGKRWVRVAPRAPSPQSAPGTALLLARAVTPEQVASVGNQTGGRVLAFLETDNFERDYAAYLSRGVVFVRPPRQEPYGTVAVFQDLYGNTWDLIQPRAGGRSASPGVEPGPVDPTLR